MRLGWLRQTVNWLRPIAIVALFAALLGQCIVFLHAYLEPLYFGLVTIATIPLLLYFTARLIFGAHARWPWDKLK
jgi:hypothetical protein